MPVFVTNRRLNEGATPKDPNLLPRKVTFNLTDLQPQQHLHFCDRLDNGEIYEVGSDAFFGNLKISQYEQLFFYIHGFNVPPTSALDGAKRFQQIFDKNALDKFGVVPIVWACEISATNIGERYMDDRTRADGSGVAFARFLLMFLDWRDKNSTLITPCIKKVNILAHSMGNRVLRQTFIELHKQYGYEAVPRIFNNIFMVAADLANETLEKGEDGELLPGSCRNLCVYFANDDLALSTSKVVNTATVRRQPGSRIGHTGTQNLSLCPKNVYEFDCSDFNTKFDPPLGHGYLWTNPTVPTEISPVLTHMFNTMINGRPALRNGNRVTILPV
jgi:esterase/lipase superfamily enzyme